ncbi:hypothetical protein vseg_013686 [Gypsophila vaccaria]
MGSFVELLLVALMPVVELLLMSALGLLLALKRVNILCETARHHLNQVLFYVFGPALVGSYLAQTLTLQRLLTMWFIPVNIFLTFAIGSALGWVLGKLTRVPKNIHGLIVSSCAAGNLGAMPLIIIPAICKQKASPFGAADVCTKDGLIYASLSMAIADFYIWLYIYNIVRICSKKAVENSNANESGHNKQLDGDTLVNIPETENQGSSDRTDASPPVDVVGQLPLMLESINHVSNSKKFMVVTAFKIRHCIRDAWMNINLKTILTPSAYAVGVGFFIGLISPLRKLLFDDDAPLHVVGDTSIVIRDACIPLLCLILGAILLKGLKGSTVKFTIILGIIVVRYVCLPLVGILIVKGVVRAGFVQSHDLLQFVSLLQYALPPSLTTGVITQLFGESESEYAVIMLWTYAVAPVTVTLWDSYYMWLVSRQ